MSLAVPAQQSKGIHRRLYDWVLHWSAHRHAQTALFAISAAEASVFPIPPDVLLAAMVLSRPARAWRYAAQATAGSICGGLIGYGIGWGLWQVVEPYFFKYLSLFSFTPENFEWVQQKYQSNAFLTLFTAGFTPIPYKVFTVAAGVFLVNLPVFLAASFLGRAGRFFLVALLLQFLGPKVMPFIEKYLGWLTLLFVALIVLGFWAVGHFAAAG